ncbi:MAG: hypothetical protein ACRDF4_01210, partial [Rhabdochlamydiaceae bacterium]
GHRRTRSGGSRLTARKLGDNPKIRKKAAERKNISLREPWEVEYALRNREIRKGKDGYIHPVEGKTHVSDGRLVRNE